MDPNQQPNSVPNQPPPQPEVHNPLATMQPGEQVLVEIKRSNIGLINTYFAAVVSIVVMAVLVVLIPHYITGLSAQIRTLLVILFVFVLGLVALFTYITRKVYKANRWILTSDSLTQVSQVSLFRKQTSQLSLANLEDVTAEQSGILQSMYHYGTLRVETAGERSKFVFPYCPDPNGSAQKILMARENFIRNEPGEAKRANDELEVPRFPANDPAAGRGI